MLDCRAGAVHLANGARIVSIQTPDTGLTSIMMHVQGGGDSETQWGDVEMTHLLEHMVAKLTSKKYPCSKQVSLILDTLAVRREAVTSSSENYYLLEGQAKYGPLMLDILLRAFVDFEMDLSIFENEKAAVQQELQAFLDSPDYPVKHAIDTILFPGTKRSLDLSKVIEMVHGASPARLLAFRSRHHIPENLVLVIAAAHPAPLFQEAQQALQSITGNQTEIPMILAQPLNVKGIVNGLVNGIDEMKIEINIDSSETFVYMAIPVEITPWDRQKYALEALCWILSRGHSSRLMKSLRTESGLIYQAFCYTDLDPCDASKSLVMIETSTTRRHVKSVIRGILRQLANLAHNGIRQDELERFKNQLDTDFALKQAQQSPSRYIKDYTDRFQWTDSLVSNKVKWEEATSLTKSEIDNLARLIFQQDKILIVVGLGTS